ncbi:hypothetical protein [Paenibacillus arenosi]|uniref:Uncharacterized protein n=1 Tax=Paenibacillus arenosi TaxID=2774142 RepID=A0ABR9AXB0_9BACL|nr:hypothetical protein [Paenibacillus arenosi]MBD8498719.1 hypothetical protein [Paenibacillus arenosi]
MTTYQPLVKSVVLSTQTKNNDSELVQLIVTLQDATQLRLIRGDGIKSITRLLSIPCPICRKDFYCKCFDRFVEEIDGQVEEKDWK